MNYALLTEWINSGVINQIVTIGNQKNVSIAYILALSLLNNSHDSERKKLAKLFIKTINETSLNAVISTGKFAGFSLASCLVLDKNTTYLTMYDDRLLKLINETSLNSVIKNGDHAELPLAYACAHKHPEFLTMHNGRLLKLINETSLNAVIRISKFALAGFSLAYILGYKHPEFLTMYNNRLLQLINETSLNAVISNNDDTGLLSLAYVLVGYRHPESLTMHDDRLLKLIDETNLNMVIKNGKHSGKLIRSIVDALAQKENPENTSSQIQSSTQPSSSMARLVGHSLSSAINPANHLNNTSSERAAEETDEEEYELLTSYFA